MHDKWQRPLIEACKREIARYLDELDRTDDLDLWEETAAKMNDVIVVFRRLQEPTAHVQITPAQIAEAAFCAAVADELRRAKPATDQEWREFMDRELPRVEGRP